MLFVVDGVETSRPPTGLTLPQLAVVLPKRPRRLILALNVLVLAVGATGSCSSFQPGRRRQLYLCLSQGRAELASLPRGARRQLPAPNFQHRLY